MPTIAVNDIEMYYERAGDHGPWILLVHGLGSSARDWEHQIPELAAHHRVLAVDLRGHGRSSRRAPASLDELASDVAALLRALAIESAYVAGISMGTGVAFQLAVDVPALVSGLVIINGGPEGPASATSPEVELRIAAVRTHGVRGIGELLAPRLLPGPERAAQRATFVERWADNDSECYLASLTALVGWSVRGRLGALACPCAFVTGDRDYTPVALKERYVSELADGQLVVIPDSGHMTTHDQPAALTRAIATLVAGWDSDTVAA